MIKLDEHFSIEKDPHSFKLSYLKLGEINKETGKPIRTTQEWYYASIKQCLTAYIDKKVLLDHQPHNNQISEVLDSLNQIQQTISKIKL